MFSSAICCSQEKGSHSEVSGKIFTQPFSSPFFRFQQPQFLSFWKARSCGVIYLNRLFILPNKLYRYIGPYLLSLLIKQSYLLLDAPFPLFLYLLCPFPSLQHFAQALLTLPTGHRAALSLWSSYVSPLLPKYKANRHSTKFNEPNTLFI